MSVRGLDDLAVGRRPVSPFRRGAIDIVPLTVGTVPFGILIGVAAAESHIDTFVGWLTGPLMVGGSAQLAALGLLDAGASVAVILGTVVMINARSMLYSAALAETFTAQPRWFRWSAPYALVDQMYLVVTAGTTGIDDPGWLRRYYLAAAAVLFGAFWGAMALGAVLGPVIPAAWRLGFAVPLLFLGMLVPALRTRPAVVSAVVAVAVAVGASWMPNGLGLLTAIVLGAAAGTIAEGVEHD